MRRLDRFRSEPVYNTRAVVRRTGVPADTFRTWERRHGLPRPVRTDGNQRLYSERDIATIEWLRDQTQVGLTISQAVALFRLEEGENSDAGRFSSGAGIERNDRQLGARTAAVHLAACRDRVVQALVTFDGGAAERAVEEAIALVAVEDVCSHVLTAGLIEVGERWQRGQAGVGSEHYASCFVMRKLAALFNLSQPHQGRGPIVAACVEGELHEIGLLEKSLLLSRHGFRVVYLGANLPCTELVTAIRAIKPPLVLLSATTGASAETLIEAIPALRAATGRADRPVVGYGGRIFLHRPELRSRVEGIFLGGDARETVESVDRLVSKFGAGAKN
jgi:methanogenic corrinoid protein MtbC1